MPSSTPSAAMLYTISGTVYDEYEFPMNKARVIVFDKDIRSEQKLGEATTDDKGVYSITYTPEQYAASEYKTADVFLRVYNNDGVPAGDSPVYYNVPAQFILNFRAGNKPVLGLNEFEALQQLVRPLIEPAKLSFADLQETDKHKDISFLAGETGEEFTKLSLLPIAFSLSKQTEIPADIFYGLIRLQLPTTLDELANIKSESLLQTLQTAIKENIISSAWEGQLTTWIEKLNGHATNVVLSGNTEQQKEFKQLISGALPQQNMQQAFVNTWFNNENTPDKFWTNLAQQPGFDNKTIDGIQSMLKLNHVTNYVPSLSVLLYNEQQGDTNPKRLANYTTNDWESRIASLVDSGQLINFPAEIEGNTPQEKTKNYAASIDNTVKQLFPTEVFNSRLTKDQNKPFGDTKDLQTFFSKNANYDIGTNTITNDLSTAVFDGVEKKEQLVGELKNINRLYKLTNEYNQVSLLRKENLTSASDIVLRYGRSQLGQLFKESATDEQAKQVYDNALSVHRKAMAFAAKYKTRHDLPVYVINGAPSANATQQIKADLQTLFNEATLCDCEECTSVHSPAAYLVDLLQFLRTSNSDAFDELLRRRPDIQDILLTCINTNRPLPYIDLVNELLENIVVNETIIAYQTTATAGELAAYPQNLLQPAYDKLNTSNASYALPLDLPLETTRVLFEKLGIKRQTVLETYLPNSAKDLYNEVGIAIEVLQLSATEVAVLNGTNPITGKSGALFINTVLQETGLNYVELLQVLESYFINPLTDGVRLLRIASSDEANPTSCDLHTLVLHGNTAERISTIIRFVRLQKKTGWTVYELDRVLKALSVQSFDLPSPDAFNQQVLIPIANIVRVKNRLSLSIPETIALFATIDAARYIDHTKADQPPVISFYDQLFRNKLILNPIDAAFTELPGDLTGTITGHEATLLSAFNNTLEDLTLLSAGNGGVLAPVADSLNLQNLSELFRRTRLAAALKLSVKDFFEAIQLTGMNPFTGNLADLLRFTDTIGFIKTSGVSLNDLNYLLRNVVTNANQAPSVPYIASVLDPLRTGLKKISTEIGNTNLYANEEAKALITDKLSSALRLDAATAKIMIVTVAKAGAQSFLDALLAPTFFDTTTPLFTLDASKNPVPAFPDLFNAYRHSSKLALLVNKFRLTTEETNFLVQQATALEIAPLLNNAVPVPFTAFKSLAQLIQARKALPAQSPDWFQVLNIAIANEANAQANYINALSTLTNIAGDELTMLLGTLNVAFPAAYIKGSTILQVIAANSLAVQAGSTIADLVHALQTSNTTILNGLLKARSSEAEWLQVIKPISNRLRIRRRDALVAYILNDTSFNTYRTEQGISDVNSLYEFLLIDTEMDACMYSSRIKQAISTVQLFIDRCLMNIETNVQLNADFASQWNKWRKQYRVWEANRKIFLYPENWIVPELRDDKTPFFDELEAQLLQNEVTADSAKDAIRTYLEKLDAVANLQISGVFPDALTGIVHVIGRTRNTPSQYYYRYQQQTVWSPWEKIDLDIEGDHILPVVWNNRLMLFWPQFTEKQVPNPDGVTIGPSQDTTVRAEPTYLEIKLAWTEYKTGKWLPKKISKEVFSNLDILLGTQNPRPSQVTISSLFEGDKLLVNLHLPIRTDFSVDFSWRMGAFVFDGCNASPVVRKIDPTSDFLNLLIKMEGTQFDNTQYAESQSDLFKLFYNGPYRKYLSNGNTTVTTLFNNTPGNYKVQPALHDPFTEKPVNFFYHNSRNNFFVQSTGSFNRSIFDNVIDITGGILIDRQNTAPVVPVKGLASITGVLAKRAVINVPAITAGIAVHPIPRIFIGRKFKFTTFYHPYVCNLVKTLNAKGIDGLFEPSIQNRPIEEEAIFTASQYNPTAAVKTPYPVEKMDFDLQGTYAVYNWELFFHIPLLIATRLSANQQFEAARDWFHYIFNPTIPATDGNGGPERFWITNPFKKEARAGVVSIEELLTNPAYATNLQSQLEYWEQHPFNPHAVARHRTAAYMRTTVMKYIDNLVAWADQLFARDTIESINEATLLYVLASNILGKKPERVPARAVPEESSFADIAEKLDSFSNASVEVQLFISPSAPNEEDSSVMMPLFCIPKNSQLLGYWDTIADRLFKIRHCMNIQGVVRQLPLFEPPIDPGLLVRAAALGLDLNSIMNDINPGLPVYRFQFMLLKASELCTEVKLLGSTLLSTLEKKDVEQLSLLRAGHELSMLKLIRVIKKAQVDEAEASLESLQATRELIEDRKTYYEGRPFKNDSEERYFTLSNLAARGQQAVAAAQMLASFSYLLADFKLGSGFTLGTTFGGTNLGKKIEAGANAVQHAATALNLEASMANMLAGYQRRRDDWNFQAGSAKIELKQVEKQIAAAEIRLSIAEKDLENHDLQIEQSAEVDDLLKSKFTNNDLYDYMVSQLAAVYFQSYQLAYNIAKKAEKCLQYELGVENTAYIQFGYWDSLKKGLLSGERLQYDLRRLENAYLEQNTRELEITKHISAAITNPAALLQLKETGACDLLVSESLFDLDFPGHYFRRIKSMSISLPCIAGPYTSVNATLRLISNEYRIDKAATNGADYGKTDEEATTPGSGRFRSVSNSSNAIATSNAQMDSGLFELNFRDERYLPFEGAGAVSTWRLELMEETDLRQFDYSTISDIILHLQYTAREGGTLLKKAATEYLQQSIEEAATDIPLNLLFDVPREYANAWYKFTGTATTGVQQLDLSVAKSRLPFFTRNKEVQVTTVQLFTRKKDAANRTPIPFNENAQLQYDDTYKLFKAVVEGLSIDITPEGDFLFAITMDAAQVAQLDEFFMLLTYRLS